MPVLPHWFAAARGSKRDFSERGIQGMVFPIGAGAEWAGRMVAKKARQRVRMDRSVPDALKGIVKDRL